jgi:16S rRNA (guanine966-N2)-methyltransferase
VREAIFDVLGSMGGVQGLEVMDLFCGSGAFGVEALSRGAARARFVDIDAAALAAVRTNLAAVGLADADVTLTRAELPAWLSSAPRADLALCDPPYTFADWGALLSLLPVTTAVLESSQPIEVPDAWRVATTRRYGGTLVTVVRTASGQSRPAAVAVS